eukprot:GHVT01072901.1.p1 GENE.GHVT01072901.1~~GHVT01072901.1.p1  ORF type:complete len:124 (-),score=11.65 GHVT01072901.1:431-802(-)
MPHWRTPISALPLSTQCETSCCAPALLFSGGTFFAFGDGIFAAVLKTSTSTPAPGVVIYNAEAFYDRDTHTKTHWESTPQFSANELDTKLSPFVINSFKYGASGGLNGNTNVWRNINKHVNGT